MRDFVMCFLPAVPARRQRRPDHHGRVFPEPGPRRLRARVPAGHPGVGHRVVQPDGARVGHQPGEIHMLRFLYSFTVWSLLIMSFQLFFLRSYDYLLG